MPIKYTTSQDGAERRVVVVRCRLTREEIAQLKEMARANKTNLNSMLEGWLSLAIDCNICDDSGDSLGKTHSGDN